LRQDAALAESKAMRIVIGADEHDPVLEVIQAELEARGHDVTRIGARPGQPVPWGVVAVEIGARVARGVTRSEPGGAAGSASGAGPAASGAREGAAAEEPGAEMRPGAEMGIVCCYTGTGVCMAANKVRGVRAALCVDAETARGARTWNDANVLALSLRLTTPTLAREILGAWLSAGYAGTEAASLEAMRGAAATGGGAAASS
jgi:ribose 5-phosphate isomerase B